MSLTQLIFQITHATDADTNAERDHIIDELTKGRVIQPMEGSTVTSRMEK